MKDAPKANSGHDETTGSKSRLLLKSDTLELCIRCCSLSERKYQFTAKRSSNVNSPCYSQISPHGQCGNPLHTSFQSLRRMAANSKSSSVIAAHSDFLSCSRFHLYARNKRRQVCSRTTYSSSPLAFKLAYQCDMLGNMSQLPSDLPIAIGVTAAPPADLSPIRKAPRWALGMTNLATAADAKNKT